MAGPAPALIFRRARFWPDGAGDLTFRGGNVVAVGTSAPSGGERTADLDEAWVLPGLVNAHDHLDLSTAPPLGRPPYASLYAWSEDVWAAPDDDVREALALPLADRLFLGGLRSLLAGATGVVHHGPFHRSLARPDFPARVLARYQFAHSPGMTGSLRRTYRTTDRRIPWLLHAAEGTDMRAQGEVRALRDANLLRQNTVLLNAVAIPREDMPALAAARACVVWGPESNRRLYGATAAVADLRAAGVRLGLGSDSPATGARDALSNLAAARSEGVLTDDELLRMATDETAEVARLPAGGAVIGAPADLVVVRSLDRFLAGERGAIALVVCAGRPLWGEPDLVASLGGRARGARLDGQRRALEERLHRRAGSILRGKTWPARVGWLAALEVD